MAKAEDIEVIKIREWVIQNTDLPFMHIANERKASPQYGAFLKRMGVLAGVHDIFIMRSNHYYKGLWVEVKVGTGKPTPAQLKFADDVLNEGYFAHFVWGADEGIEAIKAFYDID